MQKYIKILIAITIISCFYSCKSGGKYRIKTKDIEIEPVRIERFDVGQLNITKESYEDDLEKLRIMHPVVFEFYIEQVARAGRVEDGMYLSALSPFIFDRYTQELYRDVGNSFQDLSWLEEELTLAFKHIKYYFPDSSLPKVATIISSFFVSCATYDSLLTISLDMYLGRDYKYYPDLFPYYKYRYFTPEYMVSDVVKVWFTHLFPEEEYSGTTLLSKMIYRGKSLFFLDLILPEVHDTIKINYSRDQLRWCEKHEGHIWNQFLENKVLFNTEALKVRRYIDDAPFTNAYGFPSESSPRLGEWVGWQIVRQYVDKKEGSNLIDVFFEKDEQLILRESAYKPKM